LADSAPAARLLCCMLTMPMMSTFDSAEIRADLTALAQRLGKDSQLQRTTELSAEVLEAILFLAQAGALNFNLGNQKVIPFKMIAETFNTDRKKGQDYLITNRKIGSINRADLKFEQVRNEQGMNLIYDEARALKLKERFGLNGDEEKKKDA